MQAQRRTEPAHSPAEAPPAAKWKSPLDRCASQRRLSEGTARSHVMLPALLPVSAPDARAPCIDFTILSIGRLPLVALLGIAALLARRPAAYVLEPHGYANPWPRPLAMQ